MRKSKSSNLWNKSQSIEEMPPSHPSRMENCSNSFSVDLHDDEIPVSLEEEQINMLELDKKVNAVKERLNQSKFNAIPNAFLRPVLSEDLADVGRSSIKTHSDFGSIQRQSSSNYPSLFLSSQDTKSSHSLEDLGSQLISGYEQLLERFNNMPDTLEKALAMNQALQKNIIHKILNLENALKSNLKRQLTLHNEEEEERTNTAEEKLLRDSDSRYFLRISSFCRPYFKTKSQMPAPMNEDAVVRQKAGYLDMYQIKFRPWTRREKEKLVNACLSDGRDVLLSQLHKKQSDLRRAIRALKDPTDQEALECLEKELGGYELDALTLKKKPVNEVVLPPDIRLDWIKIAAQASDGHRSAEECEHLWNALLSTNYCQKDFSEKDDIAIQTMVTSYDQRKPDWGFIAAHLSSPRTPFQVFNRYQCFIAPALNPAVWSPEESKKLVRTVQALKIGHYIPWTQVHQLMPGFTRVQLQSKWKKIDPELKKGTFRIGEDYIFLKGLHKFGLDFDRIVAFLPTRHKGQLKDRFKRLVVANFLIQWTTEMDEELRDIVNAKTYENVRLDFNFWRRLATIEGYASKGIDAGILRMRYLIVKLWTELSVSVEPPPPLFPASITTVPEEVEELRHYFLNAETFEQKTVTDKINAGHHIKAALVDLSIRRQRLHQEHDQHKNLCSKHEDTNKPLRLNHLHMHHLHQLATKQISLPTAPEARTAAIRMLSTHSLHENSWPEQVIMDFFLPSARTVIRPVLLDTDKGAAETLEKLSYALQVRPVPVQPTEFQVLARLGIDEEDRDFVNSLVNKHTCGRYGSERVLNAPCLWCGREALPENLPLLPPSPTTVTALQSLLLHRETLAAMAHDNFVFHKLSVSEVRDLGDKQKPLKAVLEKRRKKYRENTEGVPRSVLNKIHITATLQKKERRQALLKRQQQQRVKRLERKRLHMYRKSIVNIYTCFKSGKIPPQYIGKKKVPSSTKEKQYSPSNSLVLDSYDCEPGSSFPTSETSTSISAVKQSPSPVSFSAEQTSTPVKLTPNCYSPEQSALSHPVGKGGFTPEKILQLDNVQIQVCDDGDRGKGVNDDAGEVHENSDDDTLDEHQVPTSAEEQRAMDEADNLLWHRFLSVFLWPALMTIARPMAVQRQHVRLLDAERRERERLARLGSDNLQQPLQGAALRLLDEVKRAQPKRRRKRRRATLQDEDKVNSDCTPPGPSTSQAGTASSSERTPQYRRGKLVPEPCRFSLRQRQQRNSI